MSSTDFNTEKPSFRSKRERFVVKALAMLSLVRWYNVFVLTCALYLSAMYMLNSGVSKLYILKDIYLNMNILGIACLLMAGYIINGFYDFEKDMINHPEQTIFGRVVSKSFCFNSYVFLLFVGLILSSFSGWKVFVFNAVFSFGLWFYSHKLRKKPLTGELGATLLTVSPFASISIYYMTTNLTIGLFVGYIAALTVTREVVKRMVSLKGDLIVGEKSIPILFGIRNCKYIILSFMIASMVMIIVLFPKILTQDISYYFGASFVMIFISTFILRASKTPTQFDRINNIYKGLIVLAVGSIFWY